MSNSFVVTSEELNTYIANRWDEFLADAQSLISIDSSFDPYHARSGQPFGPGPRKALDAILRIAQRMGFEVHDGDGYAGYAELPGKSGQQLGIIGHVDVVPAGEGWTFDPFSLTQKGEVLLGRGTTDDKIPLLCALYACKFWMDKGVSLRHAVRFIFGCNEETGMKDVPYYLAHHAAPDFLFTPDADFPLCYGEKGLFGVTLNYTMPCTAKQIVVSFDGGVASNAVPAIACAVVRVKPENLPSAKRITVEPADKGSLITATGISGHASLPDGTINAIGVLANYIAALPECSEEERAWFSFVSEGLAQYTDGSPLGIAVRDKDFGPLTSVLGTIHKNNDTYTATIDIRFPQAITGDSLTSVFEELATQKSMEVTITRNQEPFVVNPETEPVQALMQAYKEVTNLEVKPFTMGGATYAREFPNAVSFGPLDPKVIQKPDWVGNMHGADEGITIEAIHHAIRIYIHAFGNLAQVESLASKE